MSRNDWVRDGLCVNGDERPICPPSAVLCRECLDALGDKMQKLASLFTPEPPHA